MISSVLMMRRAGAQRLRGTARATRHDLCPAGAAITGRTMGPRDPDFLVVLPMAA